MYKRLRRRRRSNVDFRRHRRRRSHPCRPLQFLVRMRTRTATVVSVVVVSDRALTGSSLLTVWLHDPTLMQVRGVCGFYGYLQVAGLLSASR